VTNIWGTTSERKEEKQREEHVRLSTEGREMASKNMMTRGCEVEYRGKRDEKYMRRHLVKA
jgi:hypothetical protein